MEEYETMGSEFSKEKIHYLLFLLGVYAIMFFFYIGLADPAQRDFLMFYIVFGFILGVVPFLLDLIFNNNKDLPLETLSYEKTSIFPIVNTVWFQHATSIIMSIFMFLKIKVTGEAFVKAPSFQVNVPVIQNFIPAINKFSGALISGICGGVIETIVFWGFFFPTIYALMKSQDFGDMFSFIFATILISTGFVAYHWWKYGYILTALIVVFLFAIIQSFLAYIYRSTFPLIYTHFINNFTVQLFVLAAYSLVIIT